MPEPSNTIPAGMPGTNSDFKKEAITALFSIITFFFVYLLLFILALGLVALCVYGGLALVMAAPKLITIVFGLGLTGVGIMVFVFLVKFVFAVSGKNQDNALEIREDDQPKLFAFIRELTSKTGTHFPKKIFISHDVNAGVFYNSSFWSMFFPVRKNLQIGLGLVNVLNVSEFKAVLAHEFGHFSQRSMKLGSFVHHVNRIIYNMLFENTSYASFISSWAKMGNVFSLFASITVKIVQGIQWILRQMYEVVNKSYLRLSREMEFHADAVAAAVSGSNHMILSLRKVEWASVCYNAALNKCDELLKDKKRVRNLFYAHQVVLLKQGEQIGLPIQNDLPVITEDFLAAQNLSRLNFKDQWASHPTLQERTDHLLQLDMNQTVIDEPAWTLFRNAEHLQEWVSNKIYEPVEEAKDASVLGNGDFKNLYIEDAHSLSFPRLYNGFYDNRLLPDVNVNEVLSGKADAGFHEIFSAANTALPKKVDALVNDIELLNAIASKNIIVKTFDFDGSKYNWKDASALIPRLEKELEDTRLQLLQLDRSAINFFYQAALQKSEQDAELLKSEYSEYFEMQKDADHFLKEVNKMMEDLRPVYSGETLSLEEINPMIASLKSVGEKNFKNYMQKWIAMGVFYGNNTLLQRVEKFMASDYAYFGGSSFFENELLELKELVNESWQAMNIFLFRKFKTILEMQLKLLPQTITVSYNA